MDPNQQAWNYIQQMRSSGWSDDVIRQQLLAIGWQPQVIDAYLLSSVSAVAQPGSRLQKKRLIILAAIIVAVLTAGVLAVVMLTRGDKNTTDQDTTSQEQFEPSEYQTAVDQYCQDLAAAFGFESDTTGYIISERFTEEMLSDSPGLLRLKRVGDAATATVDCESQVRGTFGIGNDLLMINENGTWKYVEEAKNNAGSGFSCAKAEQYAVSRELISECAQTPGGAVSPR